MGNFASDSIQPHGVSDKGEAFHRFVTEYLAHQSPGVVLHSYLASGKDGAIDVYDSTHDGVCECKFVAQDGYTAIQARWKEVADHLDRNLQDGAPKNGQSQYQPWYNTQHSIKHYHFFASARIENDSRRQELEQAIQTTFQTLSRRQGLAHLAHIEVKVSTWDSLEPALPTGLRLRWLKWEWPPGCREFSREWNQPQQGFHKYLRGAERLNYFELSRDFAPQTVLQGLQANPTGVTVLHGRGGVGKSRLMWEVGYSAWQSQWVVVHLAAHLARPASLPSLLAQAGTAPLLLLMDYADSCLSWDEWAWAVDDARAQGATVQLLVNSRSAWAHRHDANRVQLLELPSRTQGLVEFLLAQREGLQDLTDLCKGVPVFAAFLILLHDRQQTSTLQSLRHEKDFASWLQGHIERSISTPDIPHLAQLLSHLPCSAAAMDTLSQTAPAFAAYRGQLQQDGWIIEDLAAPPNERWSRSHDVLADGALLRWFNTAGTSLAGALQRWLCQAQRQQQLQAVLQSLQRVASEPVVQAQPWHQILAGDFAVQTPQLRDAVLHAQLLSPLRALIWLDGLKPELTQGIPSEPLRLVLSKAAELAQGENGVALNAAQHASLQRHLDQLAIHISGQGEPWPPQTPNHVLVQALGWQPQRYAPVVRHWLAHHAGQPQAQFLLNAWLHQAPRPDFLQEARPWVMQWLKLWQRTPVASFVLKAWLDAGGDKEAIAQAVQDWLNVATNRTSLDARFVLTAWLDAGGDKEAIALAVQDWLNVAANRTSLDGSHVLKAWLAAGGDKEAIVQAVQDWLNVATNRTSLDARFVLKAWLDAGGDKEAIALAVQDWLAVPTNQQSLDAGFVFRAWGDKEKQIPEWMQSSACAWVQRWWDTPDAVYPLKYIAKIKNLDGATVQAVLNWCAKNTSEDDAISRLSQLGTNLRNASNRVMAFSTVAQVLQALAAKGELHDEVRATSAMICALNAWHLPYHNETEKQALEAVCQACCHVWAVMKVAHFTALDTFPPRLRDVLTSMLWQRVYEIGLPPSGLDAAQVKVGLKAWARACSRYAWGADLAALQRIMAL